MTVDQIIREINDLFSDTTVPVEKTREDMEAIQQCVQSNLDALPEGED